MLAPLLALLMASPEVTLSAQPPVQTQEQKQVPKPHPEVQKLIDAATADKVEWKDMMPFLEEALARARALQDVCGEGAVLSWMGRAMEELGENRKALAFYEQGLPCHRSAGDIVREAATLNSIGGIWFYLGENRNAIKFFELALVKIRNSGEIRDQAITLTNLGAVWSSYGGNREALQCFEQALPLWRKVGDISDQAITLTNIGASWSALGEPRKAIASFEQALLLWQNVGEIGGEATILHNIGAVWSDLGEKRKALKLYEQALPLRRKVKDIGGEAMTLNNVGGVWSDLGEKRKALELLEQALPLWRMVEDIGGEATTLTGLGAVWSDLGEKRKALDHYERALGLSQKAQQIASEATILNNIGWVWSELREDRKSLRFYEQALPLWRKAGVIEGEAMTINNVSLSWANLGVNGVSVAWQKLSVNATQSLRQNAAGISASADRSLLHSIRDRYTSLSAALQSQGRIAEALQVQELQEASRIKEFVYRGTAEQEMFSKRLSLTKLEKHWMREYEKAAKPLGDLGKQRDDLARVQERLPEQEIALQEVEAQLRDAESNFKKTIDAMTEAFKETTPEDNQLVDLVQDRDLTLLAKSLSDRTRKKVGCLATLVGEKSTSVMFIGPNAKVVTRTVNISRADLSKAVTAVLGDLNNPKRQPFATSKKLYDLVIKPFEAQIRGLDCVMFNLNGPLRYVPMAALWDGQRYLAERFQVTNFSIAVWENLAKNPPKSWGAAFFGLTQKVEGFSQLPGVKAEVEASAPLFKATPRLDKAFSKSALEALLKQKKTNLLHFGTHFALDPASSEETYMVLGDGTKWRPTEMEQNKQLSLEGVELLVAGACRTGVPTGDDASIEGFGAYCQVKGARSVLSTLWEVNDASTSTWMKTFYKLLAGGKGKGEAFHRAQLAMITGQGAAALKLPKGGSRAGSATAATVAPGKPYLTDPKRPFAHPYYWAPFTLSGNWR